MVRRTPVCESILLSKYFLLAVLLMRAFGNQAAAKQEKHYSPYTEGIATFDAIRDAWQQSFDTLPVLRFQKREFR